VDGELWHSTLGFWCVSLADCTVQYMDLHLESASATDLCSLSHADSKEMLDGVLFPDPVAAGGHVYSSIAKCENRCALF
jgi:hypothetical protein